MPEKLQDNCIWGYSSAGRALEWHSRGQRFDPAYLHQEQTTKPRLCGLFFTKGKREIGYLDEKALIVFLSKYA